MRRLSLTLATCLFAACDLLKPTVETESPFDDLAGDDCGLLDSCSSDGSSLEDGATDGLSCILAAAEACEEAHSTWVEYSIEGDPITFTAQVRDDCTVELTIDSTEDEYGGAPFAWYTCTSLAEADTCPGLSTETCEEVGEPYAD